MQSHRTWVGGDASNSSGNQFIGNAFSNSTVNFIASHSTAHGGAETATKNYREVLLKSLEYDNIRKGRYDIHDTHEDTCQWIFDDAFDVGYERKIWISFSDWLRNGSGIYWIQGKAGSGKSTLMNYICDHARTKELLSQWSNGTKVSTPTFFFWSSGIELQKNTVGLLRSLLYQIIIDSFPEHSGNEDPRFQAILESRPFTGVWQEAQLSKALLKLLEYREDVRDAPVFCFFIDGLDEFSGNWQSLARQLHTLSTYKNVKICVSSRPENAFEVAFSERPSLRVEDFTIGDMRKFITHQLSSFPFTEHLNPSETRGLQWVVEMVAEKAEGVWQWVVVSLPELFDGRINLDSFEQLKIRLEQLPPDLMEMYSKMLRKVKPAYRELSTKVLNIVFMREEARSGSVLLENLERDIPLYSQLDFMEAVFPEFTVKDTGALNLEDLQALTTEKLIAHSKIMQTQWHAACMGLVRVRLASPPWRVGVANMLAASFDFTHKTVRDFVEQHLVMEVKMRETLRLELACAVLRCSLWQTAMLLTDADMFRSLCDDGDAADFTNDLSKNQLELTFKSLGKQSRVMDIIEMYYQGDDPQVPTELEKLLEQSDSFYAAQQHFGRYLMRFESIKDFRVSFVHQGYTFMDAECDWIGFLAGRLRCTSYIKHRLTKYGETNKVASKATRLLQYVMRSLENSGEPWKNTGLLVCLIQQGADLHKPILKNPSGPYLESLQSWTRTLVNLVRCNYDGDYLKREEAELMVRFLRFLLPFGTSFMDEIDWYTTCSISSGCSVALYHKTSALAMLQRRKPLNEEYRLLMDEISERGGKREWRFFDIELLADGGGALYYYVTEDKLLLATLRKEWKEEWSQEVFHELRPEEFMKETRCEFSETLYTWVEEVAARLGSHDVLETLELEYY